MQTGGIVEETSFIVHPDYEFIGASPDGKVGNNGLLEIKCPNTAQHVACLRSSEPDSKYWWQMQCQMACTGALWCDFVSFDDRMPEALQLFVARVNRDDDSISEMIDNCLEFEAELAALVAELTEKMEAAA